MSKTHHSTKRMKAVAAEQLARGVPNPVARAMNIRGGSGAGVHRDQLQRADPKQLRRDRSFLDEADNWRELLDA